MPDKNFSQSGTVERTVYKVVRFLLLVSVVLIVSFNILIMVSLQSASDDRESVDRIISISQGTTGQEIARKLEFEGLINDAQLFSLLLRVTSSDFNLLAGDYLLNPQMSPLEIIEKLNRGRVITQIVTIPEGFQLEQIAKLLDGHGLADKERFLEIAYDAHSIYGEQLPFDLPIKSLEGYLFPDTYNFFSGQSEEKIIRQMVARFLEVVPPLVDIFIEEQGELELTLHEIVTLASIVEREIMLDKERKVVAGVYLNRLEIDMPLQADPTVRYVMTEQRNRVLYRDLEIESPYNTYRNRGLPIGPIASPGVASIKAVLEPADVDYLFFVSKRDGTHQFSHTFDEHVRARRELGY